MQSIAGPVHASAVWTDDWLCWGLTSQSTIFQSCRDGAIASWVINQYFRGVKCLAQGHNTAAVGLEPRTSRSGVRHSTTEPPRSPVNWWKQKQITLVVPIGCSFFADHRSVPSSGPGFVCLTIFCLSRVRVHRFRDNAVTGDIPLISPVLESMVPP